VLLGASQFRASPVGFRTTIIYTVRLKYSFRHFLDVFPISSNPSGHVPGIVKFRLKQTCVLPSGGTTSDDVAVTRPGILLKFGNGTYDFRTYRIEMDVPDDITEISILANYRRLVAILEEVTHAMVPLIEPHGISRQQAVHERWEVSIITL
jgi:hypothetical protein